MTPQEIWRAKVACYYALMDLARDMDAGHAANQMRIHLRSGQIVPVLVCISAKDRLAAVMDDLRIYHPEVREEIYNHLLGI